MMVASKKSCFFFFASTDPQRHYAIAININFHHTKLTIPSDKELLETYIFHSAHLLLTTISDSRSFSVPHSLLGSFVLDVLKAHNLIAARIKMEPRASPTDVRFTTILVAIKEKRNKKKNKELKYCCRQRLQDVWLWHATNCCSFKLIILLIVFICLKGYTFMAAEDGTC